MNRWLAALAASWLLVGCTAIPGTSSATTPSLSALASPAVTTTAQPPASPPPNEPAPSIGGMASDATISTVDDPYAAAVQRVIELGGSPCIREIHVEPDIESYGLDQGAARLSGQEGLLPGGKAFVGPLAAAAKGFGAKETFTASKTGRSVVIVEARGVTDIPEAAPIGYVLIPIPLKDGRTAWLRTGDYVASIPCAAEGS